MDVGGTSFAARRPAAGNLPTFSLPPHEIPSMQTLPKVPSMPSSSSASGAASSTFSAGSVASSGLGSGSGGGGGGGGISDAGRPTAAAPPGLAGVLTRPTSGVTSEGLSPLSAGMSSSQSSQSGGPPPPSFYGHVSGSWQTPGGSSYTYQPSAVQQLSLGRALYSPALATFTSHRSPHSPAGPGGRHSTGGPSGSDGLPHPPYGHDGQHAFPTGLPSGAPHGHHSSQQPPVPGISVLASQAPPPQPTSPLPPATSVSASSVAVTSSSGGPSYYAPTSNYGPPLPSPTQPSPTSSAGPVGRGSIQPPQPYGARYPPSAYHAMTGPILSNITNPGGPVGLIPGSGGPQGVRGGNPQPVGHQGHHHQMHHHHGGGGPPHHHLPGPPGSGAMEMHMPHRYPKPMIQTYTRTPPPPPPDRPFKCDTCPQSFNRNHDLKRHKRIHLAVKPFPCNFCDKSFSRKDALKLHGRHCCRKKGYATQPSAELLVDASTVQQPQQGRSPPPSPRPQQHQPRQHHMYATQDDYE